MLRKMQISQKTNQSFNSLEPVHTVMLIDSTHAIIEQAMKRKDVKVCDVDVFLQSVEKAD